MVDNRSAGFYGIGGAFNFKSGDPSGTAAKMSQEKYGSEAMYLPPLEGEEDESLYNQQFVDRSALLRATLNSLAMSNVASVLNANKHKKDIKDILDEKAEEKRKKEEEMGEIINTLEDVFNEDDE
ncbi:hypothetical protein IKQ21_07520 [bacterium]|nr:hypothetical protein [bacterium]